MVVLLKKRVLAVVVVSVFCVSFLVGDQSQNDHAYIQPFIKTILTSMLDYK